MDIIFLVLNLVMKLPSVVMENLIIFCKIHFDKIKAFDQYLTFNTDISNI